jgi:hypothetical protein
MSKNDGSKPFGPGWKVGTFASALGMGLASIIAIVAGEEPFSTVTLGGSIAGVVAGLWGLVECFLDRRKAVAPNRCRYPRAGLGAIWIACIIGLGATAPADAGCGTAFGDVTGKAGMCIARAALGCATTWVGDLLKLPMAQDTEPGQLPRPGSRLHYHVRDVDGKIYDLAGVLIDSPQPTDQGLRIGYLLPDGGGCPFPVMLAKEPRLYCASVDGFEGAQPAPPGLVPPDAPVSLKDFVERFGELPGW